MAQVISKVFTDFNSRQTMPEFYRNILAEQTDPSAQLRLLIEKIQSASNDKKSISSVGIVVDTISTKHPQTFLNKLRQKTSTVTQTVTEYRVVFVEDGIALSQDLANPSPHDIFKHYLSRYYATADNINTVIANNSRVRVTFTDTSRTDGWITEVI